MVHYYMFVVEGLITLRADGLIFILFFYIYNVDIILCMKLECPSATIIHVYYMLFQGT